MLVSVTVYISQLWMCLNVFRSSMISTLDAFGSVLRHYLEERNLSEPVVRGSHHSLNVWLIVSKIQRVSGVSWNVSGYNTIDLQSVHLQDMI